MKLLLRVFFLCLSALIYGACNDFFDVNEDPNNPVESTLPLKAKLPAALVSTVNQETLQLNQIGGLWGGYWGTTNEGISMFVDLKTYNGPAIRHQRDGIPVWENGYTTMLYYKLILEEAREQNALYYSGVAKIMLGWHFMRLVDIYDALPFDDALSGTDHPTPRYDDGKTVYEKSVNLITEGIADLKNTVPGTEAGNDDIVFNGNRTLWIKFGNTTKLRALLRQSEISERAFYIASEFQKIEQEGSGYLGAGEDAFVQPGYLNTTGKLNPFWENYYKTVQSVATANYQDIRPTVFVLEQYKLRNDPRLASLYVAVDGDYKGVLFGNPNVSTQYSRAATSAFKGPAENAGKPSALLKSPTQASVLMGSFESLFLQAEAAQRGWISGSPKDLYETAVHESFKYMEVDVSAFSDYNAQAAVSFDGATDKIRRIIEQKWLALNSISSIEAWNDYRRLGIPEIPNSLEAPTPMSRPLRFMFPETERMTNNHEASRMGSDDVLNAHVWWDR
ncbi:MAG TPA: SusD/RagB family nutrient-binding outer membrane lipoprotein [Chryseosolibacter sp.]